MNQVQYNAVTSFWLKNRNFLTFYRKNSASRCSASSWIDRTSSPCCWSRMDRSDRALGSTCRRCQNHPNGCTSAQSNLCRTIWFQELLVNRWNSIYEISTDPKSLYELFGNKLPTALSGTHVSLGSSFDSVRLDPETVLFVLYSFLSLDIPWQASFNLWKFSQYENSRGIGVDSKLVTFLWVATKSSLNDFRNFLAFRLLRK